MSNLIFSARAPATRNSYQTYINKWVNYCNNHHLNPYEAEYKDAMTFIATLFKEQNYKYGVLAVVRSALSAVLPKRDGKTFGQDELVSQMMKGIYRLRPSLPKYTVTYDPDKVLSYMKQIPTNDNLTLEILTKKLVTLLCLLSGQRSQSIQNLFTNYANFEENRCEFYIPVVLKTSRP